MNKTKQQFTEEERNQPATKGDVYDIVMDIVSDGVNALINTIDKLHSDHELRFDKLEKKVEVLEERIDDLSIGQQQIKAELSSRFRGSKFDVVRN